MNTKEHSQEYFSARGVSEELYIDVPLPAYFKEVLDGLEANARILDFGCGFGQTLNAIQSLDTKKSQSYKSSKNNENSAMGGGDRDKPKQSYTKNRFWILFMRDRY